MAHAELEVAEGGLDAPRGLKDAMKADESPVFRNEQEIADPMNGSLKNNQ